MYHGTYVQTITLPGCSITKEVDLKLLTLFQKKKCLVILRGEKGSLLQVLLEEQ